MRPANATRSAHGKRRSPTPTRDGRPDDACLGRCHRAFWPVGIPMLILSCDLTSFSTRVPRRLRPSVVIDVAMDAGRKSRCRIHICSPSTWFWSRVFPEHVPHQRGVTTDDLARREPCGIPSTARPDHTPAQGQPSTKLAHVLFGSAPGLACGNPLGGRRDAIPCPPHPAAAVLVADHLGYRPAWQGHSLVTQRFARNGSLVTP